jgi:hypothetical protein
MPGSIRTLRSLSIALTLVAAVLVLFAPTASADWSDDNCRGSHWNISSWTRAQAQTYAARGDAEGYEWNGGCYKLNNRDDTPNAPNSEGEGNDCSGFVFRSWSLKNQVADGYHYWEYEKFIHGPYYTIDFRNPTTAEPFRLLSSKTYNATAYMDAFVYNINGAGHIGMIYSEGSGGTDLIVEAKSDAIGTRIGWGDYRSQSAYVGVKREGWTSDCYPNC